MPRVLTLSGVAVIIVAAALAWRFYASGHTQIEPVYHAAKAIEGSLGVGLTYAKLGDLLQQLATELAIARDKTLTPTDRAIVTEYATAAAIYQDSLALWKLKIDGSRYLSDDGEASALKQKYHLPVGSTGTIDADTGMQMLWAQAGVHVSTANARYAE